MVESEDVLESTGEGVAKSRSPWSVGVYRPARHSNYERATPAVPLGLLWVSETAVAYRSQLCPVMQAGWYLCLEEEDLDSCFEVRVSTRANELDDSFGRLMPGRDVASLFMHVSSDTSCFSPGDCSLQTTHVYCICFLWWGVLG